MQFKLPAFYQQRPYAAENFTRIMRWAARNHPFYRQHFKDCVGHIPLLSREQILNNNDLLLNGQQETGRTSGSTGTPVRFAWSAQRQKISADENQQYTNHWLGGALPRSRIIRTRGSEGSDTLDIEAPIDVQIKFLCRRYRDHGAVSVITYPTNAAELASQAIAKGIDFSFVRRFSCYAEAFEPWQEQMVKRAFPEAKIWTTYSATELGMIAARCPYEPNFHHVFARKLGVEIIDDHGNNCAPGKLGRVVVTDYFNQLTPFIRYDIGDMAEHAECPCGKIPFPALTNIAGKVRGMLRDASGNKIMFSHLDAALRDVPGMGQFQVIQHKLQEFELRYVPAEEFNQTVFEPAAFELFTRQFGRDINLHFTQEKVISRGANGKFYASICHVE